MAASFSPLHPLFAARADGMDLREAIAAATVGDIDAAMNRFAVLVFRDQRLSEDEQLAFTARFGPMDPGRHLAVRQHRRVRAEFADVSNLDEAGNVADRNHRRILSNMATRLWHTDSSYKQPAAKFSLLYCSAIPDWGGETEFADMRAAYDALPDDLKATIEGLVVEHDIFWSRGQIGFTEFPAGEREKYPPSPQRLVRRHPGSGRKTLYLSAHASHIVGWPVADGRLLLHDLNTHATQRDYVYSHKWAAGDLVIWDNRCTMHRGRPHDENAPRDLRRATTLDVGSTLDEAA
jgi:alpha-ketoglutarate-dependent 2,4-dichlorophenoxyacetate dioxygenase